MTDLLVDAPSFTIAVLGAGAWGSTLAGLAIERGHTVRLWSPRRDRDRLAEVVSDADLIISAVSMRGVRPIVVQMQQQTLPAHVILLSATKGLDADSSANQLPLLPSQIWQQAFPENPVAVLSGPNLAKEIQHKLPAATVVASSIAESAIAVQQAISSSRFRVYTNPDPLGVELGGTLKNVMAIAVGTCDGLQLGMNAKSALITRGLAEMLRLGCRWGGKPETFYGLSGIGDLMATCNSPLSRNYQVGYGLSQGKSLQTILTELEGTSEGVNTTPILVKLANEQGISAPITQQVARLLNGETTPQAAVAALMERESKPELG
ncbi:MAG TPA: NAD(P)H-dependent glycerol-3-phosphate dehydrogenase [Leptolyngbyaceae cyanobacterium M33_DOE_097]|uniref:Glycerol-3-phosphate dehydrogenase [NAD(P)+] n=1 Tax=Oscillatoriales cyanobacterium SpSt-418 TaxID=2282169 RepID=A0A7C3KJW8_9CYAN|nr:NAD(P)H-dependent glycerol-3-phosphate dehydrogenase [Leptolyngbyaceae cyanobacterium M33_DOE_097]